ncbi:MAG: aquaporin [Paracoccaceae bacterium]
MSKKFIAELIGTFTLVFLGCATALSISVDQGASARLVAIALAFGLTVMAMAYGIGPISGAHLNPAVSLGATLAGRMSAGEMIGYWVAQVAGGLLAAVVLMVMGAEPGKAATTVGFLGTGGALIYEAVATFLFVTVILGATQANGGAGNMAGLAIGLTLTLIHLGGIQISGSSVNPARSIATNIFDSTGLAQLWLYIVAPLAGGAVAGLVHAAGVTRAD